MSDTAALLATDEILPPPPSGAVPVIHDREYRVRAFRLGPDRIVIQGAVRDQKPPGLYLDDDPDPVTVHHMQLSLTVSFPELEIVDAVTHFEAHPRDECPAIVGHYGNLVGLSVSRGFTHRVRELFGGPRGCTHTTALLQAMAPVAVQCAWSMRYHEAKATGRRNLALDPDRAAGATTWRLNLDTCHAWRQDGPAVAAREAGQPEPIALFLRDRVRELGLTVPTETEDTETMDPRGGPR